MLTNLYVLTEQVLIETYWNVKRCSISHHIICDGVLIETYWNVKKDISSYYKDGSLWSINRNILECKDKTTIVFVRSSMY